MSDHNELNMGGLLQVDDYRPTSDHEQVNGEERPKAKRNSMSDKSTSKTRQRKEPPPPAIDAWCFVDILLEKWKLILLTGCLLASLGFVGSYFLLKKTYMSVAKLMRYEPTMTGQFFKPPVLTPDTFSSLLKSPELLQIVSTNAKPRVPVEILNKIVFIKNEVDSDVVTVAVKGFNPEATANLANLYAQQAVQFTLTLQRREAEVANRNYYTRQLTQMSNDIAVLREKLLSLPNAGPLARQLVQMSGTVSNLSQQVQTSPRVTGFSPRLMEKLQLAQDELSLLTKRYTDAHPLVVQQRAQINSLQTELASSSTNSALGGLGSSFSTTGGATLNPEYDFVLSQLRAIQNNHEQLMAIQREAEAFAANPPGNVRFFSPATIKNTLPDKKWLKVALATVFGGLMGMFLAMAGVMAVEFSDHRLKTASDVNRVTKLPVIATLEDLENKGPTAREKWAFRTWTMLQGRLSPSPHHGLVCGITSSGPGEGRSTWINMLAEAASMSGFRVLTIATRQADPTATGSEAPNEQGTETGTHTATNHETSMNGHGSNGHAYTEETSTALSVNALLSPREVTDQLTGPDPQPLVHIPLPGWVWNLERRKQWQEALAHWQQIDNLVILVELPPANMPEAVLLGGNLPNVVWLAESGKPEAAETKAQLETLRHARCNLVGAVLNREPSRSIKHRFPRWLGCMVLALCMSISFTGVAQTNNAVQVISPIQTGTNLNRTTSPAPIVYADDTDSTPTNVSFSLINPENRGEWQKRLTLGAGDVLSFSLYGQPELARADVFVGPDGRVSYLEANNILAAGLTIDELRTNIDNALSEFRRAPRSIITPVLYNSKKYYMLGKIVQRGAYTLDKPTTVLEAVARARGLETGLSDRNSVDMADFERSFLMRKGKRYPINFEKLFGQGDLTQNIAIEPDDYLFFPPATLKEVYVLGAVRLPGIVPYTRDMTVIGAIAIRAGFTERAYKSHVVVIRGSLNKPQAFVVNALAILDARGQDFKLQPKDIIFVSERPFVRAEDLIDLAITAFIQSAFAEWAGVAIGPIITSPILPTP